MTHGLACEAQLREDRAGVGTRQEIVEGCEVRRGHRPRRAAGAERELAVASQSELGCCLSARARLVVSIEVEWDPS